MQLVLSYISLGAITAWASSTNWAGVWMKHLTGVCVILSAFALSLWTVLVLLWTSVREVGVFVSLAYFLKCNVLASTFDDSSSPVSARSNVRSGMQCFIKCIGGLGNRALVISDCGAIAGPDPTPNVRDCVLVVLSDFPPVFKGCGVIVLRDRARAVQGLQAIAAGLLAFLQLGLHLTLLCGTWLRLTLDMRWFDTVCSDHFNLAFLQNFEHSATPWYDLVGSIVRSSQWWFNCNARHNQRREMATHNLSE